MEQVTKKDDEERVKGKGKGKEKGVSQPRVVAQVLREEGEEWKAGGWIG